MIVGDKAMEVSMPEQAYASLFEEFEDFWKGVKEGGKPGEHEHFKIDAILGGNVDQDWNLGIRIDGIENDTFQRTKKSIVDRIMENGPYTGHGSKIALPIMKLIANTVHRQGFTVNDLEAFYTRSNTMHTYLMGGQIMVIAQCTGDDNKDFAAVTMTFWKSDLDLEKAGENMGFIVRAIDEARKQPSDSTH
jgi:hypothetical protein